MMWSWRAVAPSLVLLVPLACSDPEPDPVGPPEVLENGSGALREADIRASLQGSKVELSFPLERKSGDKLEGVLSVRLVDASKPETKVLATAQREIEQDAISARHSLMLDGLPEDLERHATAPLVISWRVELDEGALYGQRSLYSALGKLEVELRGATEVPADGSVPFRVIVRDPNSLEPKVGADVAAFLEAEEGAHPVQLFSGKTDVRGELLATLALPGNRGGAMRVEVKDGTATAWSRASVSSVRNDRLALSTDKTIYKPGQTIELRALGLTAGEKTPLASREVLFEALDGKGNKIFKRRATTDEYGVVAIRVPTDSEVNEGVWTFRASIDDLKAEKKLPVTRYNLPKIKVSVATDREFALAGDRLQGRIDARYVFGAPVTGAQIALTLENAQGALQTQQLQTSAEGQATFDVAIPANAAANDEGAGALKLVAQVTDTAGQQERGETSLPVAAGPLVIRALSEAGSLIPNVENIVYLLVSDPVGRPLVATLQVAGLGPLAPLSTDADGVAELRFTPQPSTEPLRFEVQATDGANRTHRRSVELARSDIGAIIVRTDKAVYKAGDIARVEVLSTIDEGRVYLDVYRGGQGVESRTLTLENGLARDQIAVTAAMRGLLVLDAFALAGSGEVVRGAQRALVDPEDKLQIELTADEQTYAPGAEAAINVRALDSNGAPKIASIGLTAVDEAVFALGGDADDNLRVMFNLDRRVLPAETRVLGLGAAELFESSEPARREKLARLLFAAGKTAALPGIEYNSIREELPRVQAALSSRVQRDAVLTLKSLMSWARENRPMTEQKARTIVLPAINARTDAFGQRYRAQLGESGSWQMLTVRANGADELEGTPDDVKIDLWWGWIEWASEADVDDNGDFNGGVFDAAAEGGPRGEGVNVPPAPEQKTGENSGGGEGARVRSDFRETVYVNPTLITDSSGRATVRFPLADSITTWRISAQGSTRDGKIGSSRLGVRTFQNFFVDFSVPTSLTKGDVVELPAVVYNYLDTAATVRVRLEQAPWMEVLSPLEQSITLEPSAVRAVKFSIRAARAGEHTVTLRADAGNISDALVREARVAPGGQVDDQSISDKLNGTRDHTITVPADAIEGGTRLVLNLTPGFGGEVVSGVEGLLQEPSGCFEQTTSSAWPNTIVTTYLDVTGQLTPELREQAFGLVLRGYQRLLTFESPTGGFNWWGDEDPGNRILSAIMLWHLKDMEGIIETDEAVRDRTLRWLLDQQQADGSWAAGDALHSGNEVLGTNVARTTAFISWALAHTGWANEAVRKANGYLAANLPPAEDLYANALAANAFAAGDPSNAAYSTLINRLDDAKEDSGEGRFKWPTETPSWTGAGGDAAAIETTGLVAYSLLKGQSLPAAANGAVRFIVANKDAVGSWYNTQATMNALRALLAAASPTGSEAEGTLTVMINGQAVGPIMITREDGDVSRKIDLTDYLRPGDNTVTLSMAGSGELSYQLSRRAHRPRPAAPAEGELGLTIDYGTTTPRIGQSVRANVQARFNGQGRRDQVMVRVGRAPGFVPRSEQLDQMVSDGRVSRYEINEREVTFYLMAMNGGESRDLSFDSIPNLVFRGEAPASSIYAYYERNIRAEVDPVLFDVSAE